ncbi:L,D-transpeptidase [Mesorhizobium sp. M4B.F.Ca.ET.215.01.1.1]|nr:L,D-transpeptidase [Mesorhizobium sp. M4B.F.Ca.ET.013.02.1.1]TGQ05418.1 L,D-transpeptidase [Mesorhizobium sp. M4B.F.Ca.ET.215.01.1.1]TGQ31422.1 L,D-transpeptidase [Mesorhizobium sp. M00.F.Ca.ET.220.01.1.1]TGQ98273.1 L,D-transpeptidase [Mesorhizobium sp. M4B.F.Ca.ET.203.01.1.1]TGT42091.1 L,D-transpeptidase [Mesorhizobium sp. M4B.F.Ca.ET.169.01.1.1]TIW97408.1 MAG: L,D-transpeptidase [Mesorhizobium sp.]
MRAFIGASIAVAALVSGLPFAEARSALADRPPLPAMGPSLKKTVAFQTPEQPGTIIIRKDEKALYLVTRQGQALRYQISVGRDGFGWTGTVKVGAKTEWPEWRPPKEMRARQPGLPDMVPAGPYNPLGARALYLLRDGRDTLYRIHGTNDPKGVGFDGTSGCFRLTNTDVIDLFKRVAVGAKVVVE